MGAPPERATSSRRTFLLGAGAASVLAITACQPRPTVPVGSTGGGGTGGGSTTTTTTRVPSTTAPAPVPSDPYLRAAWAPLVGQRVVLTGAEGSVDAVLDAIEDVGPQPHERCFALAFRSEPGQPRLTLTDRVGTASAGQHPLQSVPTDRGQVHQWYHAVVYNPT